MEKVKEKIISAGVTIAFNKGACKNIYEDKFQITIKGTGTFCLLTILLITILELLIAVLWK